MRRRSGHVDRLRRLNLPAEGKAQAIVDTLERADAAAAETALRQHLSGTLSFIDQIRRRFPDWVL